MLRRCLHLSSNIWDVLIEKGTLDLAKGLIAGKRHSLAKSITLVESSNPNHMRQASLLLAYVSGNFKERKETIRIGVAGPPGAGNYYVNKCNIYNKFTRKIDFY